MLKHAIQNLLAKAPQVDRVPLATMSGSFWNYGTQGGQAGVGNQLQMLTTFATVGWLFSTISRIAEGVAAADWQLFRKQQRGERIEIFNHPALAMWEAVNPFVTRQEHVEASQQHFELVGEMWWVINFDGSGVPRELQLVRPDRMRPIPDRENFIQGYVYNMGAERIMLAPEEVILTKRPSPLDPYRGIGVIQALLVDLGAEQAAAQWNRNFFQNSAEPGGIIEFEKGLSDAEFNILKDRWEAQHRGVSNAHRVALLERGTWKDVGFSQRNMQFKDLRMLSREIILDAFGMPRAMIGISESVNRANAEVAEYVFSKWIVAPRLERIKKALNNKLLHPFFGEDLEFDYADPTPRNREFALSEATQGYSGGLLTLNEARERLGEGEVPGGEDFQAPAANPFMLGLHGTVTHLAKALQSAESTLARKGTVLDYPAIYKTHLDDTEDRMDTGWAKRLATEAAALVAYLETNFARHTHPLGRDMRNMITKIELSDVDAYDWDWWSKYGEEAVEELTEVFEASLLQAYPQMDLFEVQRLATIYAEHRGAELLRLDGSINLVNLTRARVRSLVAGTIERGDSLQTLQKSLREDFAFSRSRAAMVARTETATALGQGSKQAAIVQGQTEKAWFTQGDADVETDICRRNAAQGWIAINDIFQSGHETIPGHPRCRCTVLYRGEQPSGIDPTEGLEDDVAGGIAGSRAVTTARLTDAPENGSQRDPAVCSNCGKNNLLVNRDGPGFWCRRCNNVVQ